MWFVLAHQEARRRALACVQEAPDGYIVSVQEPKRNLEQSAKFHAMCANIAKSGAKWAGKSRSTAQWKVLMISGHAVVTKEGADMVPGIEGEFVNLRESTALMSKRRTSSLIEYTQAWISENLR